MFVVEEGVPCGVARGGGANFATDAESQSQVGVHVGHAFVADVFRVFEGRQGRDDGTHAEPRGSFHEGGYVGESAEYARESGRRTWGGDGVGGDAHGGAGSEGR